MAIRADKRKYHYIYKITRADAYGRYYIGMHSTDNLEDGYFGSGSLLSRSIKKHGKDKHVKEILEYLPTREALKLREKEIVNEECIADKWCMNLKLGGEGGWDHITVERIKASGLKGSLAFKNKMLNDQSFKKKFSESLSKTISAGYISGDRQATGWSRSATNAAQSAEAKAKRKETRAKLNFQQAENNSQFGTKWAWVNKDQVIKKIPLADLENFVLNGWQRGLKYKI